MLSLLVVYAELGSLWRCLACGFPRLCVEPGFVLWILRIVLTVCATFEQLCVVVVTVLVICVLFD